MADREIKWSAQEFDRRPKGVSWYWLSMIVAVVILGIAVWQKNFLFGFFVVVAEILVLIWGNREPGVVGFALDAGGLAVGNKKHIYSEFENFSAENDQEKEWLNLFLNFKSRIKPALKVKIPKARAGEIKRALASELQEIEHQPSLLDAFEEFFGF